MAPTGAALAHGFPHPGLPGPLPVAGPLLALGVRLGRVGDDQVLLAVADAAVVLAPYHFVGIGVEVRAGEVVVNANLRAAGLARRRSGRGCCY